MAQVVAGRGNNLHEVREHTGDTFLVSMPTKFRSDSLRVLVIELVVMLVVVLVMMLVLLMVDLVVVLKKIVFW